MSSVQVSRGLLVHERAGALTCALHARGGGAVFRKTASFVVANQKDTHMPVLFCRLTPKACDKHQPPHTRDTQLC